MKKVFILFIALIFTSTVYAQDFSVNKLENGQTVIIKEIHDNPIVTIDTWIKTGSINEDDKTNGIAHFLEHLFFKGTQKYPTGEYDKLLESKGAITNAATSKDFTHYYVTIPSQYFNLAITLHSDMLLNPLIPRKELEKERKVVLEEITKSKDNPQVVLYNNLINILYKDHPYKRQVIGKNEIIETITREEILDYYNKYYTPSNMVTVIVGDVDTQPTLKTVEKLFSEKNYQKTVKNKYKKEKLLSEKTENIQQANVNTGYMLIGFRGVNYKNKKDSYALDVLATILGEGKTSRLYQNIKEQRQLAYSIKAGHSSYKEDSLFFIQANFIPQNRESLENAIINEFDRIKNNSIDKEELDRAKSIIERSTYFSRESISNIAEELGFTNVIWGDSKYYKDYIANINKVTSKDIKNAAKKYLDIDQMAVSVLIPSNSNVKNTKIEENKKYKSQLIKKDNNISKIKLENNATLLINHNQSNDIVAIEVYVKGGNFIEKIPGTSSMMATLILKGTNKYTQQDISHILESNGIELIPSAGADAFGISIKTTKKEIPIVMDILNEIVNNAKFDKFDIEKTKSEKIYAIKKSRDNTVNIALDEYKSIVYGDSIYAHSSKLYEKTIPTIQRDDIIELYKKEFDPENIVISINGNVDDEAMINYFSQIFPVKQNSNKIVYKKLLQGFKPVTKNSVVNIKTNKEGATVVLGWKTDGILNKKDYATLQIIDSILGSGMSSRLFSEVRDQQGLAYQIGSIFSPKIQSGCFTLYISTNPSNLPVVKKELFGQINKLKREFVTDNELQQAKDKLLGNYILSFETNKEKASTLGWFEASERGYEFNNEYQNLIKSVTASDIIGVANKYFELPYVYVVVSPKK